jgi:hypothetical protein
LWLFEEHRIFSGVLEREYPHDNVYKNCLRRGSTMIDLPDLLIFVLTIFINLIIKHIKSRSRNKAVTHITEVARYINLYNNTLKILR